MNLRAKLSGSFYWLIAKNIELSIIFSVSLAIKLKRLREKSARYSSHKISYFVSSKWSLSKKGLELTLEWRIGNYDQEFINNWYSNLKDFSLILMKQNVTYCKRTEQKTQMTITEFRTTLKQQLKKDDYAEMPNTI